jgi:hypothetical protein
MQFWDMDGKPHFKVPNGSEISSLFTQSLWFGGLDDGGTLHLAAERYRQVGTDYWPGPVSDVYDSIYDMRWLHVWNLKREEVEFHKANWWKSDYEPIHDILTWPGNGDLELGQSEKIAPFEDNNNNGIYEPLLGDAPQIRGDQALFFVYNDCRKIHTESGGVPFGLEIRAMAYAFDKPEDSALWNTIFIHYDIENRSDTAYQDMCLGIFTDTDLGDAWDDRIECDVEKGMYFTYNGVEVDGLDPPQSNQYGNHPPAQGIQILGGPYLNFDGIDNPKFDALGNQVVDYSINGLNFGDGVVDNERLGMTNFIYFGGGAGVTSSPNSPEEHYWCMQSKWRDNSQLQYGGYGHIVIGAVGPACNFMWPNDSDPYNWGTNGLIPNGGYNQNGFYWTEEESGANPSDRKGLGSMGPFEFIPGQVHSLDIALPWARDFDGTAWSSALLLKERAAYIKELYQNDPDFFSRVEKKHSINNKILVYPNPVSDYIKIKVPENVNGKSISVFTIFGRKLMDKTISKKIKDVELDCADLPSGIYILQLNTESETYRTKFVKK